MQSFSFIGLVVSEKSVYIDICRPETGPCLSQKKGKLSMLSDIIMWLKSYDTAI